MGDQPEEKRKQSISTGKNRGEETNLRKRETKWISTGKNRGGGLPKEKRENEKSQ